MSSEYLSYEVFFNSFTCSFVPVAINTIVPVAINLDDKGKSCGWRCPACQFVENNVPNAYRCFCGKFNITHASHSDVMRLPAINRPLLHPPPLAN